MIKTSLIEDYKGFLLYKKEDDEKDSSIYVAREKAFPDDTDGRSVTERGETIDELRKEIDSRLLQRKEWIHEDFVEIKNKLMLSLQEELWQDKEALLATYIVPDHDFRLDYEHDLCLDVRCYIWKFKEDFDTYFAFDPYYLLSLKEKFNSVYSSFSNFRGSIDNITVQSWDSDESYGLYDPVKYDPCDPIKGWSKGPEVWESLKYAFDHGVFGLVLHLDDIKDIFEHHQPLVIHFF